MPLNAKLTLTHTIGGWDSALEIEGVSGKKKVADARNEIPTGGYALVNLRASWLAATPAGFWRRQLFDRGYALPTSGAYTGQGTTMGINTSPGASPSPAWAARCMRGECEVLIGRQNRRDMVHPAEESAGVWFLRDDWMRCMPAARGAYAVSLSAHVTGFLRHGRQLIRASAHAPRRHPVAQTSGIISHHPPRQFLMLSRSAKPNAGAGIEKSPGIPCCAKYSSAIAAGRGLERYLLAIRTYWAARAGSLE